MATEHPIAELAVRIVRGGDPGPEVLAAIVVGLDSILGSTSPGESATAGVPDEWALQGRMNALGWQPLFQRWPGEPPGRSWRRVVD